MKQTFLWTNKSVTYSFPQMKNFKYILFVFCLVAFILLFVVCRMFMILTAYSPKFIDCRVGITIVLFRLAPCHSSFGCPSHNEKTDDKHSIFIQTGKNIFLFVNVKWYRHGSGHMQLHQYKLYHRQLLNLQKIVQMTNKKIKTTIPIELSK